MAEGKKKAKELTIEEKLKQALVLESDQPYKIPKNWRRYRISGLVTHLKRGKAPKYVEHSDIPVFAQKCNQKNGTIDLEKAQFLNPELAGRIKEEEFLKDKDVLINSTGTGTLGRVGYYRSFYALPYCRVLPDSHITVIRGLDIVSQNYLYYYLKSKQEYLEQQGVGTTNQKELRPEAIGNIIMPLPPLPEQQRIVDRIEGLFTKLDKAKEKAQAVVDGFEDRKAAILHKACTGELTEEWRNNNQISTASWIQYKYGELGSSKLGKMLDKAKNTGKPVPYLRNINVRWFAFDLSDVFTMRASEQEINSLKIQDGDLFICEGGEPGRCAIWRGTVDTDMIFQKALHRFRPNEKVISEYLCYYLYYLSLSDSLEKFFTGTTIKHLTGKSLTEIPIKIPRIEEQLKIIELLDRLFEKEQQAKESAEQVIAQIDTMKKSILARAFRGELGTNNPSDESAEELLKRIL